MENILSMLIFFPAAAAVVGFLIDKDSIQVKELLGKPNYKNTNENVWTYEAGTGGGFGFVDHFLEIYYKKNKVQKIEHKRIQD